MSINKSKLTANSTILDFLKTGGTLEFPDNAKLKGDAGNSYISTKDSSGKLSTAYPLSDKGLSLSLKDKYAFTGADLINDKLNSDSTLLDFMKLGGSIILFNGSELRTDTAPDCIDMIECFDGSVGVQELSEEGLNLALKNKDLFFGAPDEDSMSL